jgi:predicted PolB exonuclease-like 3'-5' exonuclease
VYFQSGDRKVAFEEDGVRFEGGDEKFLLSKFWELAAFYDEFVTFAGRTFDVPVLMLRSAMVGIRPSKNLMANRYVGLQPSNARHIDLKDQFTFYGAKYERLGLHFWCGAFGIPSPKIGGVTGDEVTPLFRRGEYEKIARYCLGDTIATAALFRKWEQFLRF